MKNLPAFLAAVSVAAGVFADNPYLPSWECVPDGEPRVLGDRVYVYGSHDIAGGWDFCLDDYVTWSAPTNDLTAWRREGVIYRRTDDPENADGRMPLYAPDCVKGVDGRYYLYYVADGSRHVGVAVSPTPGGKFEFLSYVRHADGRLLGDGEPFDGQFDPAVLVDGNEVYLYTGGCGLNNPKRHGAMGFRMRADMVTLVDDAPTYLVPGNMYSKGTSFDGHAFFEGSSIRKVDGRYVFVYSSEAQHELCYATSDRPLGPYVYGGVLVSNADIGIVGPCGKRADRAVGYGNNNHGGMAFLNGDWWVFYHRHTMNTMFSRQGCAERLERTPDGGFRQAEMTSTGLLGKPFRGIGEHPAYLACNLFVRDEHDVYLEDGDDHPRLCGEILTHVVPNSTVGFKYLDCRGVRRITLKTRGWSNGEWHVRTDLDGPVVAKVATRRSAYWREWSAPIDIPDGVHAVYLTYCGTRSRCGFPELKSFELSE